MKITIPGLNERSDCIPALAEYFLKRASDELLSNDEPYPTFAPAAMEALQQHTWNGNVRELENTIQRALIICKGEKILPSHLGFSSNLDFNDNLFEEGIGSYEQGKQKAIEEFQQAYIQKALERTEGNISHAAELCGLTRAAFQRIMRKLKIQRKNAS